MQNPFAKWFAALSPKEGSVIGVDFGSAYLKVVQLRRQGGRAILETYGSLALGPYAGVEVGRATRLPIDKQIEALKDLLREARVTTTQACIAIPASSSLVLPIEMPALPESELAQAVPIEARKFVPVPMGEVALDWWLLPEEPGAATSADSAPDSASAPALPARRTIRVLISAIHREALTRFDEVGRGAGLTLGSYEVEVFSTLRALVSEDLAPHAVLDCAAGETKLSVIDRGTLRLSHTVNHGGQDLTLALSRAMGISVDAAEQLKREKGIAEATAPSLTGTLNALFSEVLLVLRSFAKNAGHPVGEIILAGGGANLSGLPDFASRALGIPASRANPFTRVVAPAFLDDTLRAAGPEFAVAVGAAFKRLQEVV